MMKIKDKLKHIPNILCIIRLLLIFVFIFLALKGDLYAALVVFFVAGATDVLDGYLARRNNWVSDLGKILDPLADKLMQFTVLVVFYFLGLIPIWFVIPFVVKDGLSLLMGMLVIKKRNIVIVSKWYGKMTVVMFYLTIAISVIFEKSLTEHPIVYVLIFMPAIIMAIAAFVGYLKHYSALKNPESELSKSGKIQ